MNDQPIMVYVTAPSRQIATDLAKSAIERRLAACVNVLGEIASVYRWDEKVTEDTEIALIFKTTQGRLETLTQLLRDLHPYECPAIAAFPLTGGNPDFLAWIVTETGIP